MKTAVLYISRKGYVKEVAEKIKNGLAGQAEIIDLKKDRKPDLSAYQNLVFGGSVMAGRFHPKVKKFIQNNIGGFADKKLYLLSCGLDDKNYMNTLHNNFSDSDLERFSEIVYAGGRYLPEQYNGLIRKLMAKINGAEGPVHREKWENVDKLIASLG